MNSSDIVFDENYCMYGIFINEQVDSICLSISDGLKAADEVLQDVYKDRISNFVNSSEEWFPIASNAIESEIGNTDGLQLITIFILFEQNQKNSVFGLSFELDADEEHGRGMMLDGGNFKILKYGDASVSFEGIRGY
jgi:hypothetical protein